MIKQGSAHFLSIVLNPVFATFATLILALAAAPTPAQRLWSVALLVLNIIAPLIIGYLLMQRGYALDGTLENVRVKRDRIMVIIPLIAIGILEWYYARILDTGQPFEAAIVATTALTAAVAAISYHWKISHHMANISGLIFVAALIFGISMIWLVILLPVLGWARLELNRHNDKQLIAGTVLAPAVILPIFYFSGLL